MSSQSSKYPRLLRLDLRRVHEAVVVSQDSVIRKLYGGITVYAWQRFCEKLWACGFRGLK